MGRHHAPSADGDADEVRFLRRSWPALPRSVADVRRTVRAWLNPMRLPATMADDIVLVVAEAVTNSVSHAYLDARRPGPVEVTLLGDASGVFVEVADRGRWRDLGGTTGSEDTCGRGLALIQRLAEGVLIHRSATDGTKLTCTFPHVAGSPECARESRSA